MVVKRNSKSLHRGLLISTFCLSTALSATVYAQQFDDQTTTANPSRAAENLQPRLTIPQGAPEVTVDSASLIQAPEGAESIYFTMDSLVIDGNVTYSDSELSSFYSQYIGEEISLLQLYNIANDIGMKYRNNGYILTQVIIPPQTISDGAPRLQVVEGRIDQVTIRAEENDKNTVQLINNYASFIKSDSAVNIQTLERQLLLINDLPGLRARSIVSASETTPGAADLLIIVERKPYDALITVDNYGSRYLGPVTLGGVVTLNSALGYNEAITAQFAVAPDDSAELLYGSLDYEQPIGPYGTRFGATVSKTKTDPGFVLNQFDVEGDAELYSVRLEHPFIRSRQQNLDGTVQFDWRDIENTNNIPDPREDNLRILRAGLNYGFVDRILRPAANEISFIVSRGLSIFGASNSDDAQLSRPDGDPTFTKGFISATRLQNIAGPINLQLGARGQISDGPLLSSEEFGVGGYYSGRGYDPSEIIGDEGVSAQAELQWNNPIVSNIDVLESYQLFAFYDIGKIWNDDATTAADEQNSLASSGFGLRFNFENDYSGSLTAAFPLSREVESEGNKDPKFYFSLTKRF